MNRIRTFLVYLLVALAAGFGTYIVRLAVQQSNVRTTAGQEVNGDWINSDNARSAITKIAAAATPTPRTTTTPASVNFGSVSTPQGTPSAPLSLEESSALTATALCFVTVPPGQGVVAWAIFGSPTPDPNSKIATVTPEYVSIGNTRPGDPVSGKVIFGGEGQCSTCHNTDSDDLFIGPSLKRIALRAPYSRPDVNAEQYLTGVILDPDIYAPQAIPGVMPVTYKDKLTPQQIRDVVAYLMTLKG